MHLGQYASLPQLHRGLGGTQDRAQGSIHNILQIEFDLDRPRGCVRDRLGPVVERTVNPSDQGRKGRRGGVGYKASGEGVLSEGHLFRGKRGVKSLGDGGQRIWLRRGDVVRGKRQR